MSKAVFVLDEMPESCHECDFMAVGIGGVPVCCLDDEIEHEYAEGEGVSDRPDWCPLHELPDKRETRDDIDYEEGFAEGWNRCLDEIMRKENTDGQAEDL